MRNISNTIMVVGLSLSMAGGGVASSTDSMLTTKIDSHLVSYSDCDYGQKSYVNTAVQRHINNIYVQHKSRKIDKVAGELFGVMRDATKEERDSVYNYIKSISKSTGVNFFNLC